MENLEKNPQILKKAKARVNFKIHLVIYILTNILFWLLWVFGVSFSENEKLPWPIFTTGTWGVILIFHYLIVF